MKEDPARGIAISVTMKARKKMSIIIKGLDMPTCSNEDCVVVIRKGKAEVWQTGYKERTLEAIQIPTPHGRLIDGDLFKEIIKDSVPAWTIGVKIPTYGDMDIMDKIYFIPTILEAEE